MARYYGRNVRALSADLLALALLAALAVACNGDGTPSPEGPTTLSLAKTVEEMGEGEFRFTLELANEGENDAVNVTASDVWQEGIEVTEFGTVDGAVPERIADLGLSFIFTEFEAGKRVRLDYTARCVQSGDWDNIAVATSINSDSVQRSLTVSCP